MARSGMAARTIDALRADVSGSVDVLAYLLIVTIIGIGLICGFTTFRDQMVQGLGDIADAMTSVNQSYTVHMTFAQLNGSTTTLNFGYVDPSAPVTQTPGQGPAGIDLTVPSSNEQ